MQPSSLLFYASGAAFEAEQAGGQARQTFLRDVQVQPGGVTGHYFCCEDSQLLAWKAPGNIYAQRGTLSFFWRSRYPMGPTAFPIFRVGYADHSSWDCVFLRVDWSGKGFEALVTDINLSRARVAVAMEAPAPDQWTHFAVAWDELWGLKFYLNGKLAAQEYRPGVYSAGLDQFGPHSRIISSWQVQSDYNFVRGGDICEIAIHDQMLPPDQIASLASGVLVQGAAYAENPVLSQENWLLRNGLTPTPPAVPDCASVRKVEIHDAYDLKRWWWKGCDGIRETTWPGVFNRSRLKGRNDYFQLPDWDCYSLSGKSITFTVPDEPFNHVEISGSAFGRLERLDDHGAVLQTLMTRPAGMERTANALEQMRAGKLRFTNEQQEEPIGDFSLYQVSAGCAPEGIKRTVYRLGAAAKNDPAQQELTAFIRGRYPDYERNLLFAGETGGPIALCGRPFVHIVVPYQPDDDLGLDGVEIAFGRAPLGASAAVQIKDPLWYYRNLAHFVFSCEGGAKKTIFFDTRDRILPQGKCLYLTIAANSCPALEALLDGMTLTMVYKSAGEARAEHVLDRFTQVRDLYGHLTEEHPSVPELNMFNRIYADVTDLIKIAPEHKPGQYYYYDVMAKSGRGRPALMPGYRPDFTPTPVPQGVPAWAFEQIENLRYYKRLINWYIDNRQIENGELGGGLSDDGDFVATWGWLAMMGSDREKVLRAMADNLQAFYDQGLFTNGLCSIQADELHSSEEGLVTLAALLMADPSNPKWLERAMENARSIDWISGINPSGYRFIRSCYFNGSHYAADAPWDRTKPAVYSMLTPSWMLSRFNANRQIRQYLKEMADGVLAHYDAEKNELHTTIRFGDDHDFGPTTRAAGLRSMLQAASNQTGNPAYESMLPENQPDTDGQRPTQLGKTPKDFMPFDENGVVDKAAVAARYHELNFQSGIHEYYNTLGSCWIDRVQFSHDTVACHRVGDPTGLTARAVYPMGRFGWRFQDGDDEKVAILAPCSRRDAVRILVANISGDTVCAQLVIDDMITGRYQVVTGIDTTGSDRADAQIVRYETHLENTRQIALQFAPNATTVVELTLLKAQAPSAQRYDLGICPQDVRLYAHGMNVTVHSLGCLPTPPADIVLRDAQGNELGRETLPSLPAPNDLWPRYRDVIFNLHGIASLKGCTVEIDPENKLCEITRANNIVRL